MSISLDRLRSLQERVAELKKTMKAEDIKFAPERPELLALLDQRSLLDPANLDEVEEYLSLSIQIHSLNIELARKERSK